jgi:hypothetical protein
LLAEPVEARVRALRQAQGTYEHNTDATSRVATIWRGIPSAALQEL